MNAIKEFLNSFLDIIYNALGWMLNGLIDVFKAITLITFEGSLVLFLSIIQALDVGNLIVEASAAWGLLPPGLSYLISKSGIPTGLSILGYAWTIRFMLNIAEKMVAAAAAA